MKASGRSLWAGELGTHDADVEGGEHSREGERLGAECEERYHPARQCEGARSSQPRLIRLATESALQCVSSSKSCALAALSVRSHLSVRWGCTQTR